MACYQTMCWSVDAANDGLLFITTPNSYAIRPSASRTLVNRGSVDADTLPINCSLEDAGQSKS